MRSWVFVKYTMLVSLIFMLSPTCGYAQSIVEAERVKKTLFLDLKKELENAEGELKKLNDDLKKKGRDEETRRAEEKQNKEEAVQRSKRRLEETSEDLYHLSVDAGLRRARKVDYYLEQYDKLNTKIMSETDQQKKAGLDAQRVELQKLIEAQAKQDERLRLQEALDSRFQGFGFGIALGAIIDVGGRDRIESAILDPTGRVRVEEDSNVRANFMLESHYFFTPNWMFPAASSYESGQEEKKNCWWRNVFGWVEAKNWGMGPFIALQPGSNNIIESVGVGWMFGFKRTALLKGSEPLRVGDSFNIGVGALIDIKQKVLGDGIRVNEPLPTGETDIRYRETSQIGAVVIFSYSFY